MLSFYYRNVDTFVFWIGYYLLLRIEIVFCLRNLSTDAVWCVSCLVLSICLTRYVGMESYMLMK